MTQVNAAYMLLDRTVHQTPSLCVFIIIIIKSYTGTRAVT